jgi:hypothetical protein
MASRDESLLNAESANTKFNDLKNLIGAGYRLEAFKALAFDQICSMIGE